MYGVIVCGGCGRRRIADLSVETSACPYCGHRTDVQNANVIFRDEDQGVVRAMLDAATGFSGEKKAIDRNIDPMSSLIYETEHISDVSVKMEAIAEGLTRIKGTFTEEDVEEIVPGQGAKYVRAMLSECMIHEVEYGKYRA